MDKLWCPLALLSMQPPFPQQQQATMLYLGESLQTLHKEEALLCGPTEAH